MKDFFHSVKFKIILGILALAVGIIIYAATVGGSSSWLSSALGGFFAPVQRLSASISQKVTSTIDMLTNARDYFEENQELKDKIAELTAELADRNTVNEENIHLREMVGLKEDYPDLVFSPPCAVIGRTANDVYQSFTIDKGENDGISLRDPVVTSYGMVGIVTDVQKTYSIVTTILSHELSVGVYCSRTRETGIVSGSYELAIDGRVLMKFVNIDSTITEGDIIVTSGHSGLVPQDRIIGFVDHVETDSLGLSLNVYITPSVDFTTVKNVFVITSFEGQGYGYDD